MSTKTPTRRQERIIAIFPGALGDFVCFLPALQHLARRGSVELFARSVFSELVPNGVLLRSLESYEITRLFVEGADVDERLRRFYGGFFFLFSSIGRRG